MQKRGQATIFIIVGIVILITIILILFLRGSFIKEEISPEDARKILNSQLNPIEEQIENCISSIAPEGVKILASQGGTLTPLSYTLYNGTNVQYLCYKEPGITTCIQKPLTRSGVETQISDYVKNQIFTCLDLSQFEKDKRFKLTTGKINVNTEINDNNVQINLNYPITLSRAGIKTTIEDFSSSLRMPLGKIIDLTSEIINSEIETGEFNNIGYMVKTKGEIIVERHTPFPDEVYVLKAKDNSLIFQFGIEGESTI